MRKYLNINEVSNLLDISIAKLKTFENQGKLTPKKKVNDISLYDYNDLKNYDIVDKILNSNWDDELKIKPIKKFNSIELFAGAGGLALGMEKTGFNHLLLNEIDKYSCETLRRNRPKWNVLEQDISTINFTNYKGKVDIVTGGFPCQAFSAAGKKKGFEDTRGTLFFEFARCINEVEPTIFIGENVKGLFHHDNGNTLEIIKNTFKELGYVLIEPTVLKAMYYKVPQKRERLFLIGVKKEFERFITEFKFPSPYKRVLTLRDAFYKGELYDCDVPESEGDSYPNRKKEILEKVPQGGYWKDLPLDLQKEYMGGSFYLGGGKTGLARRLSLDSPSLTLVCAPAMKQTERCHPVYTRPLTIRESARIQTFPDDWIFYGAKSQAYKQIGNAVPVNLAWSVGRSVLNLLNKIENSI